MFTTKDMTDRKLRAVCFKCGEPLERTWKGLRAPDGSEYCPDRF
jgi:hypothetical protein